MKSVIPRFAYALLAILAFAAVLLTIGQRETEINPVASSYNPSGLHAFQELLEANGIPTEITRLQQPRLQPNDLAIAAYSDTGSYVRGPRPTETIDNSLLAHLKRGGKVLVLPFDPDFRQTSKDALVTPIELVNAGTGDRLQINHSSFEATSLDEGYEDGPDRGSPLTIKSDTTSFVAWKRSGVSNTPFVTFARTGDGTLARAAEGLFVTNRFIDRNDNAKLALALVQGLLKPGGRVVFTEATLGQGIEPSLVSTLGPWAVGAWMQVVVLFLVFVFTLGIRFGLPDVERRVQRGQRDLIDAVTDIYRRSRSMVVALDAAYAAADVSIRRAYRLPSGVTNAERDAVVPPELARVLKEVDEARKPILTSSGKLEYSVRPSEARDLVARLDALLAEHLAATKNRIS